MLKTLLILSLAIPRSLEFISQLFFFSFLMECSSCWLMFPPRSGNSSFYQKFIYRLFKSFLIFSLFFDRKVSLKFLIFSENDTLKKAKNS